MSVAPDVTGLLRRWSAGDPRAHEELLPLVYAELRRIAQRYIGRERKGHTLQATALVHEAYLHLVGQAPEAPVDWQNRAHFLAIAATLMRRILVDHARAHGAKKRGGGTVTVALDAGLEVGAPERGTDLLRLDEALERLAAMDPKQGRLVELRYFGGLTVDETAAVLGSSPATIKREWSFARAWLKRELRDEASP